MKHVLIIHYGEITLKGRNRHFFERVLAENVRRALQELDPVVTRQYGRLTVEFAYEQEHIEERVDEALNMVPGVANYAWAWLLHEPEFEDIEKLVLRELLQMDFTTFAIRAKRSDKTFPIGSNELAVQLGSTVVKKMSKTVDLEKPDVTVKVRATSEGVFVSFAEQRGPGGLPVGTSGKVVALLSAGIDSPVASWQVMTRGANVQYVHFHSYPVTSQDSIDNAKELVGTLQQGQPNTKLYLVPLADMQQEIAKHTTPKLRVVLYRRAMFDIAQRIAGKAGAKALVTGESLGQVASQTLENMHAATEQISIPILRPLIGIDKEAIVRTARHIGTYDISIRPYEDCCSLLMPDSVETRATLKEVHEAMQKIDWEQWITDTLERMDVLDVVY